MRIAMRPAPKIKAMDKAPAARGEVLMRMTERGIQSARPDKVIQPTVAIPAVLGSPALWFLGVSEGDPIDYRWLSRLKCREGEGRGTNTICLEICRARPSGGGRGGVAATAGGIPVRQDRGLLDRKDPAAGFLADPGGLVGAIAHGDFPDPRMAEMIQTVPLQTRCVEQLNDFLRLELVSPVSAHLCKLLHVTLPPEFHGRCDDAQSLEHLGLDGGIWGEVVIQNALNDRDGLLFIEGSRAAKIVATHRDSVRDLALDEGIERLGNGFLEIHGTSGVRHHQGGQGGLQGRNVLSDGFESPFIIREGAGEGALSDATLRRSSDSGPEGRSLAVVSRLCHEDRASSPWGEGIEFLIGVVAHHSEE